MSWREHAESVVCHKCSYFPLPLDDDHCREFQLNLNCIPNYVDYGAAQLIVNLKVFIEWKMLLEWGRCENGSKLRNANSTLKNNKTEEKITLNWIHKSITLRKNSFVHIKSIIAYLHKVIVRESFCFLDTKSTPKNIWLFNWNQLVRCA